MHNVSSNAQVGRRLNTNENLKRYLPGYKSIISFKYQTLDHSYKPLFRTDKKAKVYQIYFLID